MSKILRILEIAYLHALSAEATETGFTQAVIVFRRANGKVFTVMAGEGQDQAPATIAAAAALLKAAVVDCESKESVAAYFDTDGSVAKVATQVDPAKLN